MAVKPIARPVPAFDASQNYTFLFVSSGNQITKNRITIRNNATNVIVYQNTITSLKEEHLVPANTLINGTYYNYYINTYANDVESLDSNVVQFYCYTQPTLTFSNVSNNGTINSATYSFELTYNQTQDELLDYVYLELYSSSGVLYSTSPKMYSSATPPIDFSYSFSGFGDNENYQIRAFGKTINDTLISSDLINFTVLYTKPVLFSEIYVTPYCNDGYVEINSNLTLADGESNTDPIIYIRDINSGINKNTLIKWGESYVPTRGVISAWTQPLKIDIRFPSQYVRWTKGYNIPSDFEMAIWIQPTFIYRFCEMFKELTNELNGYNMKFVREIPYGETSVKDYFELSGYNNGVLTVYQRSNYVDIMTTNDDILVWIKKVGQVYTLQLQIVTKGATSTLDWGQGNSNVDFNTLTTLNWGNENYTQGTQPNILSNNMDSIFPIGNYALYSGIYNNMNITKDTTLSIPTDCPAWTENTILNCDFNGNIRGGSVGVVLDQLSSIKIKRRKVGTFNWVTIYQKEIVTEDDMSIDFKDYYTSCGENDEWALVPVLSGNIEGDYLISSPLTIQWNGTFLSNPNGSFKLYNAVTYNQGMQNIRVGVLQPIGREFPIVLKNSINNNYSGTITATLLGYEFETTRQINRQSVIKQRDDITTYLTTGNAFCITDWNGNIWIARNTSSPTFSYVAEYGNGALNITFSFVTQGKYMNQSDMYQNGFFPQN